MISLNSAPPVSPDETKTFFALLTLVTDPKASAKRIQELIEAAEKAAERERRAKIAESDLAVARDRHDEYLRTSLAEHEAKLKNDRVAHDHHCGIAMEEVRKREAESIRLNDQARADTEAAAQMKSEVETRLSKLRLAMEG